MNISYGDDTRFAIFILLAAPAIGSFLGVLAIRLPTGRPVLLGHSACDYCGTQLGWRDLVPLVSAIMLRFRCRYCHAPISRFHLTMELAALIPPAFSMRAFTGWPMLAADITGWALIVIIAIAWQNRLQLAKGAVGWLTWFYKQGKL